MPDQTSQSDQRTTADWLELISEILPDEFPELKPELKLHFLVKAANSVFDVPGDYVLVDGNLTLIQLLAD